MKCIIIDDEIKAIENLKRAIDICSNNLEVIATASNVNDSIALLKSATPDIVFLDIEILGGSSFDVLSSLYEINFKVIFVTAHQHYAIKAIRFSAFDYLLKPIDINELKVAIERASISLGHSKSTKNQLKILENNIKQDIPDKIALPTEYGYVFIPILDIIRCQAESNYTKFFLVNKTTIITCHTLGEYEKLLSDCGFFRVHNSHLINLKFIRSYTRGKGGSVTMSDGSEIEVSVRKKEEFFNQLSKIFISNTQ